MKHLAALLIMVIMASSNCKAMKPETVITVTFSGEKQKTIRVHKGDTLLIKLQMASGTGFVWQASGKPILCKQLNTTYEHTKRNKPGAPLIEVMDFITVSSGVEDMTFVYRRPFENKVAAAKTKTLRLIVQ
jgi:predicted secreted protein